MKKKEIGIFNTKTIQFIIFIALVGQISILIYQIASFKFLFVQTELKYWIMGAIIALFILVIVNQSKKNTGFITWLGGIFEITSSIGNWEKYPLFIVVFLIGIGLLLPNLTKFYSWTNLNFREEDSSAKKDIKQYKFNESTILFGTATGVLIGRWMIIFQNVEMLRIFYTLVIGLTIGFWTIAGVITDFSIFNEKESSSKIRNIEFYFNNMNKKQQDKKIIKTLNFMRTWFAIFLLIESSFLPYTMPLLLNSLIITIILRISAIGISILLHLKIKGHYMYCPIAFFVLVLISIGITSFGQSIPVNISYTIYSIILLSIEFVWINLLFLIPLLNEKIVRIVDIKQEPKVDRETDEKRERQEKTNSNIKYRLKILLIDLFLFIILFAGQFIYPSANLTFQYAILLIISLLILLPWLRIRFYLKTLKNKGGNE